MLLRGRLAILAYHRVLEDADPLREYDIEASVFDSHMRVLARFFNVLPLPDAIGRLREGALPARAVSITFDDGYADNYHVALPILKRLGLPATVFVATGFLDGGRMWNDTAIEAIRNMPGETLDLEALGLGTHTAASPDERCRALNVVLGKLKYLSLEERLLKVQALAERAEAPLPDDLMLTSQQVAALSRAGVEIGAHTVRHPILTAVDVATAEREISDSKSALEEMTGAPVRVFAYPNGTPGTDFDERHVRLVREAGYYGAVACTGTAADGSSDVYQLPRFLPWRESSLKFGLRMLRMHLG